MPDDAKTASSVDATRAVRERLHAERAAAIEHFRRDHGTPELLNRLRASVDAAIVALRDNARLPADCVIVAVGGYGRGELFPRSDVDILVLLGQPLDATAHERVERFIGACWDLGLTVGHSVRTLDECVDEAARDITIQTALVEARRLAGSRALYTQLRERLAAALDIRKFVQAKLLEMRQRHIKHDETPYSLEPNCKESQGGLRDTQIILWIARAAGLGESWRELAERELITHAEAVAIARNERFIKTIRVHLHLLAGRTEDRLLFDLQESLAADMGFSAQGPRRASEVLMQRYYWAAKAVVQLNTIVLQNIGDLIFDRTRLPARPIDERFRESNGLLDIDDNEVFERDPGAILEAFLVMQRQPELKGMSARLLRALWHARGRIDADFRADPRNRANFLALLQSPRGIVHELRRLNQTSVLGRYLPAFRRIIGQMQHDLFHAYTVDQHIMNVLRNLRRFTMAEHAHEYPLCSRLIANFERHWLLYVAALFHDIAKGRGGDHSKLGMVDARRFCKGHELSHDDTELVVFLVEQHLTMSNVAQKRDLSDPDVIRGFAEMVGDRRRLAALYLLTVADIRGTSPKVWNAWKAKLLEDLYNATDRLLATNAPAPDRRSALEERRAEALRILRLYAFSETAHEALWSQLDVGFFLRHDAQTIAWLTRSLHYRVDAATAVVKARLAHIGDGLEVAVYTRDEPDLFARVCGYFDSKRFSILDARVHTTRNGYALDTFIVVESGSVPGRTDYRSLVSLVETELAERIDTRAALHPPSRGRIGREIRNFPIEPTIDLQPDERAKFYFLTMSAADRSGLLYAIARVLAEFRVSVHSAKIMTLGDRVEDSFVVSGTGLSDAKRQLELETRMLAALHVPDAGAPTSLVF
uniref:[protein-PII] uridylyltransferase n=1 Tax=Derxia lacustris TaxID=764842 RepID=UPI001F2A00C9|nr:[protein-PII] uridylyltransferase [Derxia lacustris]